MIDLECLKKRVKRAGDNFLVNIFTRCMCSRKKTKILSGEGALLIFNIMGVEIDYIFLMAIANGLEGIDEIEFNRLLDEQKERHKNMKQCGQNGQKD
jgi:alanyl-tRNA synthetase